MMKILRERNCFGCIFTAITDSCPATGGQFKQDTNTALTSALVASYSLG